MRFNNPISEMIWNDRYKKNDETLHGNFDRVARFCSTNDEEYEKFLQVMEDGLFFPAGRTMSNSAIGSKLSLVNCHTAPQIDDSFDGIFSSVMLGAKTHQRGGNL